MIVDDWIDRTEAKPVIYIRAALTALLPSAPSPVFAPLKWRLVAEPLILKGDWEDRFINEVAELCLGMAAGLDIVIF